MAHRRLFVDRTLVVAWRMPEQEDVDSIVRDLAEHRAALGRPLLYLSLIGRHGIPQGAVREKIAGFYQSVLESCESMHIVIEGSEFEQSIKRSVIANVLLVVREARGRVFVENTLRGVIAASPAALRAELAAGERTADELGIFEFARFVEEPRM